MVETAPSAGKAKRLLESLGFSVYCLDDATRIGGMLGEIQSV